MSPTSAVIESLCARYGVPCLEAQEFYLTRLSLRGGIETLALADLEIWCRLWVELKGDRGPQLKIGIQNNAPTVRGAL